MLPGSVEVALDPPRNRTDFRLLKLDLATAELWFLSGCYRNPTALNHTMRSGVLFFLPDFELGRLGLGSPGDAILISESSGDATGVPEVRGQHTTSLWSYV
jgi:hypothetical protein